VTADPGLAVRDALAYRPVRPDELPVCADIWRVAINHYIRPLGQPDLQSDSGSLLRLYAHLQASDPERFVVASRPDHTIVGFAAAIEREHLRYLSMCFVLPEAQGAGIGRELMQRVGLAQDPDTIRATATDTAQPISNALYASAGLVPRVPLLDLIGTVRDPASFGSLPSGVRPVPFERVDRDTLGPSLDRLDRATLGVAHPVDHAYLQREGRSGWLYHAPDGAPVAYGYATAAGRIGPVAALDEVLVTPIVGHLAGAVVPRGASALWLPGAAGPTVVAALHAGFRLDAFPLLLCWDRPFADLSRYLPISPGLL
jgi:GNAT superfamily N-acetyltransferase